MHTSVRLAPLALAALSPALSAQGTASGTPIIPPPRPAIGARGVVTVTPLVPRPHSRPCVVELFDRREFQGEAPYPLAIAPPAKCPGPWARVVLENDFDVTAGAQYDRTARIELAGVNLYTGTTMEPRKTLAPRWHVERDVTDYAAVLAEPVPGSATLVNVTDAQHAGRIYWRARLIFYAADGANAPARTADIVMPLTDRPVAISKTVRTVGRTVTWPRNVVRMAIDILAMPQHDDEMWQRKLPALPRTPGFSDRQDYPFRESEVRIDGILAGFAPVFPWVFTGGMGAWNWTAIPGVGTLDLQPYRVDLTPFAGLMNDGRPHRVEVLVVGARDYMATTATLLAWRDAGRSVVAGGLLRNTLVPSALRFTERIAARRAQRPPIATMAVRRGSVTGYVDGSQGRLTTRIDQSMQFDNRRIVRGEDDEVTQHTVLDTRIVATGAGGARRERRLERFALEWGPAAPGSTSTRRTFSDLDQELFRDETVGKVRRVTRQVVSPRTLPSKTETLYPDRVASRASFHIFDSRAGVYDRTIAVLNDEVTAVSDRAARDRETPTPPGATN